MSYIGLAAPAYDPTRAPVPQLDAERFSGDSANTAFTLTRKVVSPTDIDVIVENVRQEPTVAYTVDGYTLTFTEAPPTGTNNIYVIYRGSGTFTYAFVPDGSITYEKLAQNIRQFTVDQFTANGSGQTFVLSETPASANTLVVSVDGVLQVAPENYSVSGTTLTFTEAPDASSNVVVKHLGFRTTSEITVLSPTGVGAATYGNASSIPAITVGLDGRISAVSNTAISIPSGAYVTGSNNVILTTNTQITGNVTISSNTGGLSVGPVIIDPDQTVTVSANARWVVL